MSTDLKVKILSFFMKDPNDRTVRSRKNSIISLFFKGGGFLMNLMLVPLILDFVDSENYGIWLTLSSIISWFSFFDIGISNGLRNKLALAIADDNVALAKSLISTTYAVIGVIFTVVFLISILVTPLFNWAQILNVNLDMAKIIKQILPIILFYFCFQFVLRIIYTIFNAIQQPYYIALCEFLSQLLSLIFIFFLIQINKSGLLLLSLVLCIVPLIILLLSNIFFFKYGYKQIRPDFKTFDLALIKDIMPLGIKFFIIQIAGLIQYQSANLIISHFFNSTDVTVYNIAYKLFSIPSMLFTIIMTPFWSAATEAFFKKDIKWITKEIKYYFILWGIISVLAFGMVMFNYELYSLWLGKNMIEIPFKVTLWSFIFSITSMFAGIFLSIINGTGMLKLQYRLCFITPFVFLLTSWLLITYTDIGISSVIIASVISNFSGFIVSPIQCYQIFNNKSGIWMK
ncbi:MAG: oligosaccharide flippase family protein [Turicibacter sp.]